MQIEKLVTTTNDGRRVHAHVDHPLDGDPVGFALLVHCFSDAESGPAPRNLVRGLTAKGFGVVRLRFIGHSAGEDDAGGAAATNDVRAVVDMMRSELQEPALVIGHSVGGTAALLAASEIDALKMFALIAVPVHPKHTTTLLSGEVQGTADATGAGIALNGQRFTVSRQLLDDLGARRVEEAVRRLRVPLLLLHSTEDEIVSIDSSSEIFEEANHPKSFVTIDGGDHLLTSAADSEYVGGVLESWARRYVGRGLQEAKYVRPDENRIYTRTGSSGFLTEAMANGHALVSDEPKTVGGTDAGPTPYDYMAVALGACTGMTLRMYADRKAWPLESVTVHLRHEKIHARDCESCEIDAQNIDHIDREIQLEGPLSDEQRARMIEIANRCPVHETLVGEVHITTSEMEAK